MLSVGPQPLEDGNRLVGRLVDSGHHLGQHGIGIDMGYQQRPTSLGQLGGNPVGVDDPRPGGHWVDAQPEPGQIGE